MDSRALSLVGDETYALAAFGERLFVFTASSSTTESWLEEIDPDTGGSLDAFQLGPTIHLTARDAAFDANGDLWVSSADGEIILGANVFSYHRIHLAPFSVTETWSGVVEIFSDPALVNLAGIEAPQTLADIPTLGGLGAALLVLSLASVGWLALRRSGL